jgi:predicted DNA-binding transcriptional regulator AlpA
VIASAKAPAAQPLVFTSLELSEVLGISPKHLSTLVAEGRVPQPSRLGRRLLWSRTLIEQWVSAGMPDTTSDLAGASR